MERENENIEKVDKEYEKNHVIFNTFLVTFVSCLLLFLVFFYVCVNYLNTIFIPPELRKINAALELYEKTYSNEYKIEDLIDGCVLGMVIGSKDKYGGYITSLNSSTTGELKTSGKYYGLGITYKNNGSEIEITDIIKDGVADKAGVKVGDIITHIDGNAITIDIIEDFRISIADETRKNVMFTTKDGREIYMELGLIERKKLEYEIIDNVGYITIYGFLEETDKLFKTAMDSFMLRDVEHIVIDLRGDLGGLVDTVVPMLDYITKNDLIVKLDYKSEKVEDKEIYSDNFSVYDGSIPISLIVDSETASASELFSMCLRDFYGCKIYGEKTYGKGTIVSSYTFKDKSILSMSVGTYYTQNGKNIEGEGIKPDVLLNEDIDKDKVYIYEKYINKK